MKKLISILVALAMTAMLSITAFAANPVATSTEAGEQVPTKLTKAYNKADGVGAPTNQTFNFTINAQPGQSAEQIAAAVKRVFIREMQERSAAYA